MPSPAAPRPHEAADDLARRAATLVARACDLDAQNIRLEDEAEALRAQLAARASPPHAAQNSGPEPAVPRHAWPLADDPMRNPATLDLTEHRADDAVILEAREGAAFLRRFGLAGAAPQAEAAAGIVTASARALPAPPSRGRPDISIVIPVHGQLGWTLNCLHSLLGHAARSSAEIVVVDDASPDDTAVVLGSMAERMRGLSLLRTKRNLGFLGACNHGAAAARGKLVVLLNNDTRVVAGWLDALVQSFADLPRAALVGSKMFYPDGRLQEAGGIIWRDGTAWNYGRDDDPNDPRYTHAREVDYVSGASIAVPAELWRALDGFDLRYAPAYGEDADLALRIRARGGAVWLQPRSRLIHYEGRTAGTDPATGAKAHQATNRKRLFLRWHATLASHRRNGEQPHLERERNVTRRALVIDATTPTPEFDAGSVTTMQILGLFQDLGYKPHFVPEDNFLFEPAHTPALLAAGIECAYAPHIRDLPGLLARNAGLFDVALVYRVGVMQSVLPILRRLEPMLPIMFHIMDLHHRRLGREAALRGDAALHRHAAEMEGRELALAEAADCTIVHSVDEAALIAAARPAAALVTWPFMFACHGTRVGFAERAGICFLGGYRHPPNVDAALFFIHDVLPRLGSRIGVEGARPRVVLAGAHPGPELQALAGPDVKVTGHVADLRTVFDRARVFVSPLRFGAGVKGKITTAMAYGLPVVTTSCGAEGMELVDGKDVLIADGTEALAEACARLHEDAALWRRLSARGLALVRTRHSLEVGRARLARAIEVALARRLGLPPEAAADETVTTNARNTPSRSRS